MDGYNTLESVIIKPIPTPEYNTKSAIAFIYQEALIKVLLEYLSQVQTDPDAMQKKLNALPTSEKDLIHFEIHPIEKYKQQLEKYLSILKQALDYYDDWMECCFYREAIFVFENYYQSAKFVLINTKAVINDDEELPPFAIIPLPFELQEHITNNSLMPPEYGQSSYLSKATLKLIKILKPTEKNTYQMQQILDNFTKNDKRNFLITGYWPTILRMDITISNKDGSPLLDEDETPLFEDEATSFTIWLPILDTNKVEKYKAWKCQNSENYYKYEETDVEPETFEEAIEAVIEMYS
jgi:hypothetical protein